jgi:transcriptional regulator with XRE-family HTH domain
MSPHERLRSKREHHRLSRQLVCHDLNLSVQRLFDYEHGYKDLTDKEHEALKAYYDAFDKAEKILQRFQGGAGA